MPDSALDPMPDVLPRNPKVLCDANVLYGQWPRDVLLWLGATSFLQPYWTERIEREWVSNLLSKRPDLSAAQIERTTRQMNQAFPNATVILPADAPHFDLPDPDDVHVLQAAVVVRADYLLTFNLRDFPRQVVAAAELQVIHPDAFLTQLLAQETEGVMQVLQQLQREKTRPPVSWQDMAGALKRADLPKFSAALLEREPR